MRTRSYARKDKHKPLVSNPFVPFKLLSQIASREYVNGQGITGIAGEQMDGSLSLLVEVETRPPLMSLDGEVRTTDTLPSHPVPASRDIRGHDGEVRTTDTLPSHPVPACG